MWVWLPAAAIALFAAVPLLRIGWGLLSLIRAGRGPILFEVWNFQLMGSTLLLAFWVLVLASILALPLAWLVAATDLRFRRIWAILAALPLVFPSYVAAMAWVSMLGPRGQLQQWLGVERLPDVAYGLPGATWVLGAFTYPYLFLLLVPAFRQLDRAQMESARSLGQGPVRAFVTTALPQLKPAWLAGGLLVVLYAISDLGAVSLTRYNTLTYEIFVDFGSLDRSAAIARAAWLTVIVAVVLLFYGFIKRSIRPRPATVRRRPQLVRLGRWQIVAQAFCALIVGLVVVLPTSVLLGWAQRGALSFRSSSVAAEAAWSSVQLAVMTAAVCAVLALPVALWNARWPGRFGAWVERIAYSGYALPGLVIALAWIVLSLRTPLYQTLALMLAAYVVRFLPESISATRAALDDVSPRLEEAARSLGRSPLRVLREITLPLIRPGVLAGAGLVFLTTLKELPATLLLRPAGFETLASRVWTAAEDGAYSEAALPALLLLAVSVLPLHWLVIRPALQKSVASL